MSLAGARPARTATNAHLETGKSLGMLQESKVPASLSINAERLWGTVLETAHFGATPKGGLRRLTCSDEDRAVRDWLRDRCVEIGCDIRIDSVGNIFATLPGATSEVLPIAMGSHLDTQPTGGKLDGILGVLGGLEVLRTIAESGARTHAPLMVIDWTNEEGSRFPPAMLCSGVYAGAFTTEYAYSRRDRDGKTFREELSRIGYLGTEPAGAVKFQAMFELHIEQGPILEAEAKQIGVVTGIQGMRWYEVTVRGRESHTGSTPMNMRKDALLGAARMVEAVNAVGHRYPPGLLENRPNSRNTIPGEVFFTVDLRHPDDAVLEHMEADYQAAVARIAAELGLEVEAARIWNCPAVRFAPELIDCVRYAADTSNFSYREITSGAGHDAAYIAKAAPTTMIFVPCLAGISHNEAESTTPEECARGCQVLLAAVLEYDRRHR